MRSKSRWKSERAPAPDAGAPPRRCCDRSEDQCMQVRDMDEHLTGQMRIGAAAAACAAAGPGRGCASPAPELCAPAHGARRAHGGYWLHLPNAGACDETAETDCGSTGGMHIERLRGLHRAPARIQYDHDHDDERAGQRQQPAPLNAVDGAPQKSGASTSNCKSGLQAPLRRCCDRSEDHDIVWRGMAVILRANDRAVQQQRIIAIGAALDQHKRLDRYKQTVYARFNDSVLR